MAKSARRRKTNITAFSGFSALNVADERKQYLLILYEFSLPKCSPKCKEVEEDDEEGRQRMTRKDKNRESGMKVKEGYE